MVWNTTQSSLYKAVNDYNRTVEQQEYSPCHSKCNNTQDYNTNKASNKDCQKSTLPHNQSVKKNNSSTMQNLFADKDFLLILGLILILTKEGADNKLILALAVVLLG